MKINKLKIVLDTNVFLVSISPKFKYYWIYEKLQNDEYDLLVSNDFGGQMYKLETLCK